MNSIWNSNIALFCRRFPALAKSCGVCPDSPAPHLPAHYELFSAKNGSPTAKENGKFLHSQYNPEREAEQTARNAKKEHVYTCVFFACGLGYAPNAYARLFPRDTIIIAEPDPEYFFAALACLDWSPVFSAQNVIIALNANADDMVHLIERAGGFSHSAIVANNNQMAHAAEYFTAVSATIDRAKQKNTVNTNTLERFSGLWLKNTCRNLHFLGELDGIMRYQNACPPELSAVVLAAGPTLDAVLPALNEIKKRAVLICVDTALRACLRAGVEPDFVVLVDPQYYAARHIAGLRAPTAVLITESAAYPSVFHFPCKKIVLCSSLFPLGKYVERTIGSKGALSAGGSVSTTAWDFARFIGAKTVYLAGLDLGYPDFQTHIRGATAEEKICTVATRTKPVEMLGIAALFGANMLTAKSYDGNPLLTDDRMTLFGWWFETKMQEYPEIQTFSFSEKSLAITGITVASLQDFLRKPALPSARDAFFSASEQKPAQSDAAAYSRVYETIITGFDALYQTAKKGIAIAEKAIAAPTNPRYLSELEAVDAQILHSDCKDIASLVFPTERKLNDLFASANLSPTPAVATLQRSKIIYRELQKSINEYRRYLEPPSVPS